MTSSENYNRLYVNLPNTISVARGFLGISLPFLLLNSNPAIHILAAVIFTVAAVSDYYDGWLARKQNLVSDFGKILDPTTDKILVLGALAAFALRGLFSPWWLVPIFFREIVITFCRLGWLLEKKAAAAEKLGKLKLVLQVVTISFAFLALFAADFEIISGLRPFLEGLTFFLLIATNVLTIISGVTFLQSNRALFQLPGFFKFVSAAGVGLLPGPSGTWGTLLALSIIPLTAWSPVLYWAIFAFLVWVSYFSIKRLDLTQSKDPQFVVMDEVVGTFITFSFVDITLSSLLAGFFLFRLFDILKPFPCRRLEHFPGFWGIMSDDIGAGIYACLILHLVF